MLALIAALALGLLAFLVAAMCGVAVEKNDDKVAKIFCHIGLTLLVLALLSARYL